MKSLFFSLLVSLLMFAGCSSSSSSDSGSSVPVLADSTFVVLENSAAGIEVGKISITDNGSSAITSITLSGTNASHFSVAPDGTVTVVTPPDFETQPVYDLTAVATNGSGDSDPVSITITVTNVADEVPVLSPLSSTVDENASIGTYVGNILADAGGSAVDSIVLSGTGAADFAAATDGSITVANPLDYVVKSEYNLTAVATNSFGDSNPVAVNIALNDIPAGAEVAPTLQPVTEPVNESAAVGTVVADYLLVSPGNFPVQSITLTGTGADDFSVTTEGVISVANTLVYGTVYNLAAVATSVAGSSDAVDVNITVTSPPTLQPFTVTVADGTPAATPIGDINISEYGEGTILSIDLNGTGAVDFAVETNGTITTAKDMDFTLQPIYRLTAAATGTGGVSEPVDVTIIVDHKVFASVGLEQDRFGTSVAMDGDLLVVGAEGNETKGGRAYVYIKDVDGYYSTEVELVNTNPSNGDHYGWSVDVSGDYVVVSAPYADDTSLTNHGEVYLYQRNALDGFSWVYTLTADDAANEDHFGYSVAIDGDYVVVGADNKNTSTGAAYLFDVNNLATPVHITASDGVQNDNFGWSVDVDGTTVAVGAILEDPAGTDSGSVYMYDITDIIQSEVKLSADDAAAGDQFGYSVAVSGDYVLVGAPFADLAVDVNDSGAAYVFEKNATSGGYDQVGRLLAPDAEAGDRFGNAVATNGVYALVGAYYEDPFDIDLGGNGGSAYLFQQGTDQVLKLGASDAAEGDHYGYSVGMSDTDLVVGAHIEDHGLYDFIGAAYVIRLIP